MKGQGGTGKEQQDEIEKLIEDCKKNISSRP